MYLSSDIALVCGALLVCDSQLQNVSDQWQYLAKPKVNQLEPDRAGRESVAKRVM